MKCLRSQPAVLCGPRSAAASAAGDDSKRQNRRQPQLGVANSWCYRARGARESRDLMAANWLARANQRATRPRCAERTASARASLGAGAAQRRAPRPSSRSSPESSEHESILRTFLESKSLTNDRHPETRAHRVPEIRFFSQEKNPSLM